MIGVVIVTTPFSIGRDMYSFHYMKTLNRWECPTKVFVSILLNRKSQTAKCLITIGPSTIIYISLSIGRDMYSKTVSFSNFSSDIEGTFQKQIRYACHFVVIYVCKKYEMKFCVLIYHTQIIQALQNCQMYSTFCPRILLLPF